MSRRKASLRGWLVLAHRIAGLSLAAFLVVAGLTGSLLVWNSDLDAAINPQWLKTTSADPSTRPIDALALRDMVQAQYPHALALRVPLAQEPGHALVFLLRPRPGKAPLENDEVFVDPTSGQILGERRWGDITQTWRNLMPFLYRLHYSLALGAVGTWLLGLVSLLWMVDSVIGFCLTLPASAKNAKRPWLGRWARAWKLDMQSRWRATFDLHRAGGLWLWPLLFVLAWSSFALNLPQWHDPMLRAFSAQQPSTAELPRRKTPLWQPALGWQAAHAQAHSLMQQLAQQQKFQVLAESSFAYDPRVGLYRYDVRSSLDIKDEGGSTRLFMDGDSGALVATWFPTGTAGADTLITWISNLHMASVGGLAYKLLITVTGAGVAMLSATGVLIWLRKRAARKKS